MRFLRKLLSALLVMCMVISMTIPAAAAEDALAPEGNRIVLNKDEFADVTSVWVDGVEYPVSVGNIACYVSLPEDADPGSMVTYTYYVGDASDIHTQYPTNMHVWALKEDEEDIYVPEALEDLENILQYSGSSIRITGTKGIRMITSIEQAKKQQLISGGLNGYKLLEYGTLVSWASDLEGGNPMILGQEYSKSNFAYKKGEADPVFKYEGNLMQYTNVLVGFSLEQCAPDICMRSYMILEDEDGQQMTIYGGTVTRSIGYIAWQNRYVFNQGTTSYDYVWEIIRAVYGDISEVIFQTNGGSSIDPVVVQNGEPMAMPEEPTKEGFTFGGWYTDAALTKPYDIYTVVEDNFRLYAKWDQEIVPGADHVSLSVSNSEFIIGDNATVFFYAEVTGDLGTVLLIDSATGEILATMKDDGEFSVSGDDLPGDKVFSARVTLSSTAEKQYTFHAVADSVLTSNNVVISVISNFSETQVQEMAQVDANIQEEIFVADFYEMPIEDRKDLAANTLQKCADAGLIDEDTIYYDEETATYSFMYDSGALGAVILEEWTDVVNGGFELEPVDLDSEADQSADIGETGEEFDEEVSDVLPDEGEDSVDTAAPSEDQPDEEEGSMDDADDLAEPDEKVEEEDSTETDSADETQGEYPRIETDTYHSPATFAMNGIDNEAAVVSVGDAIILWSFDQKWDTASYRKPFYEDLEDDFEEQGLNTTVDWTATVEDYKHLKGYEVIVFSGHGSYTTYTYKDSPHGQKQKVTLPSLLLHEKSTSAKDQTYTADLKNFRIGKISVKGGTMYAILPPFFTDYYDSDDLDNSFVFAENCEFYGKNGSVKYNMSQALLGTSVEAVVGFHNSVMADYSRNLMRLYILCLTTGRTAGESLTYAKNVYGDNDYFTGREEYGPTAYPIMAGNASARLLDSGIKNGSFEMSSSPVYWNTTGDTRILKQLGELKPQHGTSMAIITTGIGSAEDDYLSGTEGSILAQTFVVPENSTSMSISYDVVSEEPMEFVGSKYNDTFIIRIIHEDGTSEIVREDVNSSSWYSIDGINFDGGDNTMYHTFWKTKTINMAAYAGETITLQFVVYDMGDSIYDTAVLIDNIYLN